MKQHLRLIVLIGLLLVSLSLTLLLAAQEDEGPPQNIPTYAARGPYGVGTRQLVFERGTDRALVITAWYPAPKPEENPDSAITDAVTDASNAPYPLVIFSHGFGYDQRHYSFLEEHLASWGFVVLAPTHLGDNLVHGYYSCHARRLLDVRRTIQYAEAMTATGGDLAGMIDTEQIAVSGHSSGGITAYGAGGASLNWPAVEQYCAERPDDGACGVDLLAQKEAMQTVIGSPPSPEGTWPAIWDSRVKAVLPMAGTVELYGSEGLAEITIPMMVMLGSDDRVSPAEWIYPAYEQAISTQKVQIVFDRADHKIFADPLDLSRGLDEQHNLINHFATAFLLAELYGDEEAAAGLAPENVQFPGVKYEAEGF